MCAENIPDALDEVVEYLGIRVGDRIELLRNGKRLYGGIAIVDIISLSRKRMIFFVRREGEIGGGKRCIWVDRREFTAARDHFKGGEG